MTDGLISRKAAVKRLTVLAMGASEKNRKTYARCVNEIEMLPEIEAIPTVEGQRLYVEIGEEITIYRDYTDTDGAVRDSVMAVAALTDNLRTIYGDDVAEAFLQYVRNMDDAGAFSVKECDEDA